MSQTSSSKPDQWFFEIGDGNTYGPFPLEKLQKWAAVGNLMPTHRVRNADSAEWTIAAYVPGLELTVAASEAAGTLPQQETDPKKKSKLSLRRSKKEEPVEPPDIVGMCEEFLQTAYARRASDIHVDPEENIVLVQIRVDGELEPVRKLSKSLHAPLIGRFKVLSKMDIAERRAPQDGQFIHEMGDEKRKVSIRAACLPTTHGERMTLRLLAVETEQLTLDRLGMSKHAPGHFYQVCSPSAGHDSADRSYRQRQVNDAVRRHASPAGPSSRADHHGRRPGRVRPSSASRKRKSTPPIKFDSTRCCATFCGATPTSS